MCSHAGRKDRRKEGRKEGRREERRKEEGRKEKIFSLQIVYTYLHEYIFISKFINVNMTRFCMIIFSKVIEEKRTNFPAFNDIHAE
jgi:hypothetical protein